MNPLAGPFLPRSSARAILGPLWKHGRFWLKSPEYRAWLRFNRQLKRVPRFVPGEVRYRGLPIRYMDGPSFLSAWHEIFVCGFYAISQETGTSRPLLVDAGANIGLAPLFWKTRFADFRYIGFEPDPLAAEICRANLQAWGCEGTVHEAALAREPGKRRFQRDRADGGAFDLAGTGAEAIEVTTVRLADFVTWPVDLLKIDIEGAEDEVLADIEPQLGQVRNLFVEVHSRKDQPQNWGVLITRLQRAGFRCFLRPLTPHGQPFLEKQSGASGFDDQFNVFAVRTTAIPKL